MTKPRRPAEIAAEFVAALMHSPRTRNGLYEYVGVRRVSCILEKYIEQFRELGLLYVVDHDAAGREVLALQPSPFHHPDAALPPSAIRRRRARGVEGGPRTLGLYEYGGRQLTISQLADLAGCTLTCMQHRMRRGMQADAAVAMGGSRAPVAPRADARHDMTTAHLAAVRLA